MDRRARRALSLIEVLVVAALFASAMLCFAMIEMAVQRQGKRTSADTEVQDALALTMEAVKRDLRGARLLLWRSDRLHYRVPLLDDESRLIPGSTGLLKFLPNSPEFYRLQFDATDGWLKRHGPTGEPPRRMGRLGQGQFSVTSVGLSGSLLRLSFRCRLATQERQGQLEVYFANQP